MAAETGLNSVTQVFEPVQLTLDDELEDDDLDFGAWVESLAVDLEAA